MIGRGQELGGQELTPKGHVQTFWSVGNTPYLDCGDGLHVIYPLKKNKPSSNSTLKTGKFN